MESFTTLSDSQDFYCPVALAALTPPTQRRETLLRIRVFNVVPRSPGSLLGWFELYSHLDMCRFYSVSQMIHIMTNILRYGRSGNLSALQPAPYDKFDMKLTTQLLSLAVFNGSCTSWFFLTWQVVPTVRLPSAQSCRAQSCHAPIVQANNVMDVVVQWYYQHHMKQPTQLR